jgi:hypothetical protein
MPEQAPAWGFAVEDYARRLAGSLGVADFVYQPVVERKGSAQREISDGVLACGDDGLIVQVKARDLKVGGIDAPHRAEAWVRKAAADGLAQANGTRRRLGLGSVTLESLRGFQRTFHAAAQWPAVVIIAHPRLPELLLNHEPNTMWISILDWLGLHDRLRSTASVIEYVRRTLTSGLHPPLGREVDRYDLLAAADAAASGGPDSVPLLPPQSLDGDDETYSLLITEMIEQAWKPDGFHPWTDPDQYRRIVEDLDRIPPAMRADLGRKMFGTYGKMRAASKRSSFLYVDRSQNGLFPFVYDTSDNWPDPKEFLALVAAVAMTRYAHGKESGLAPSFALGVGVLVDNQRGVSYSFCHVETADPLDADIRRLIEEDFGVFDGPKVSA